MTLGSEKQCGNSCKHGDNTPSWYQTFTFQCKEKYPELKITIWDNDTVGSEDLMGRGVLSLGKMYENPGAWFKCTILRQKQSKLHCRIQINFQECSISRSSIMQNEKTSLLFTNKSSLQVIKIKLSINMGFLLSKTLKIGYFLSFVVQYKIVEVFGSHDCLNPS